MFKRVTYEEWQAIITLIAFFTFFTIFIIISIRAVRMKKQEREHAANLPLQDEDEKTS